MKKSYLIGILLVLVAVGLIISAGKDVSTYATFAQAAANPEKVVKLTGELVKDKEVFYDPAYDPNYFSFYLQDSEQQERKIVLRAAKPQDFERSENIVLTGKMVGEEFHASDMLMKCPSKYKDEEIHINGES